MDAPGANGRAEPVRTVDVFWAAIEECERLDWEIAEARRLSIIALLNVMRVLRATWKTFPRDRTRAKSLRRAISDLRVVQKALNGNLGVLVCDWREKRFKRLLRSSVRFLWDAMRCLEEAPKPARKKRPASDLDEAAVACGWNDRPGGE